MIASFTIHEDLSIPFSVIKKIFPNAQCLVKTYDMNGKKHKAILLRAHDRVCYFSIETGEYLGEAL